MNLEFVFRLVVVEEESGSLGPRPFSYKHLTTDGAKSEHPLRPSSRFFSSRIVEFLKTHYQSLKRLKRDTRLHLASVASINQCQIRTALDSERISHDL